MLHGWGQTLQSLKPMGELLSAGRAVHLIDLPGFGASPAPDSVWSSFDYAEQLVAYLNAHQIHRIDLLGHSFGGKIALSFAATYPERVRSLTLMGTSGLKRQRSFASACRMKAILWAGKVLKQVDLLFKTEHFKRWFIPRFGSVDYLKADPLMRKILVKSVNEDLTPHLSKIKAPTLLLWGEDDTETPVELAQRLKQSIPSSQLIIFPYKGHYLTHDVGSHLCTYHLLRFLNRVEELSHG